MAGSGSHACGAGERAHRSFLPEWRLQESAAPARTGLSRPAPRGGTTCPSMPRRGPPRHGLPGAAVQAEGHHGSGFRSHLECHQRCFECKLSLTPPE
ncbi:uncharacterized protein AAGF69_001543 isoform 2-T5 [Amazona ochrocephala]